MSKSASATFTRTSPLYVVVRAGLFGADTGAPGVRLCVLHPMSLAHVAARTGKARAVSRRLAALPGVQVMWAGPDQHYVKAAGLTDGALVAELKRKLGADASVTDQSHGRVILLVEGPKARALLAKGTAVDLHPQQFPVGMSAMTQMAHVGVHLTRVGADAFELSIFRGFAESFWNWLAEQALEFGYQVN